MVWIWTLLSAVAFLYLLLGPRNRNRLPPGPIRFGLVPAVVVSSPAIKQSEDFVDTIMDSGEARRHIKAVLLPNEACKKKKIMQTTELAEVEKKSEKLSSVARNLAPSSIQELSLLAQRCDAINLAEGFPDFVAPAHIKNAAVLAINSDFNQYRHVQGICDVVAQKMKEIHGVSVDPLTDIVICCGQSEAFAATMFAILDHGDEVILFDPSYETYETCIRLAGGVPVYVGLDPPYWTFDSNKLEKAFTDKTKALVLNSPHNPTGKVFTKDELEVIAGACLSWDVLAVTDEVYEHITFDNGSHISIASLPKMQSRTIITSSLSKTYSVTGWRVGWAIAPTYIASAIRNIHVKITDSAPAPFQEAAVTALRSPPAFFDLLRRDYESKRDCIFEMLAKVGFKMVFKPQGSVFVFAELPQSCSLSDIEFVEELIKQAGVVAVPGEGFFHSCSSTHSHRYVRFAFCKSDETLSAASAKISRLVDGKGRLRIFDIGTSNISIC